MYRRYVGLALALAALGLFCLLPLQGLGYDYSYARVVRLSLIEGDVQVARPEQQGWEQAVVNLPIQQGFTVATGGGRAEIEFESGATARLADNSALQFTELALSDGARITKLTLTQGTASFYANLARQDSFVVVTPQLQVVVPENACFRVDVFDDATSVSVFKGSVDVDSGAGTSHVGKGHMLTYRTTDPDRVTVGRSDKPDEWDRWVSERDDAIRNADTAELRYVDTPYSYGLYDLYSYGNWYYLNGYGNCWRPYGFGLGWYPYWNGRWAFYPGFGWTWVSFEPWGWLPYHFGRWVFSPTLGWLWVPGPGRLVQWQPALVTWVRVGNRVGWVPLSPHDQPGQTPANLQQGFVAVAPNRVIGTRMSVPSAAVHSTETAEVLSGPPTNLAASVPAATTFRTGPTPGVMPGANPSPHGIVFDPRTHTFVNNPANPAATAPSHGKAGDARMGKEVTPAPRPSSPPPPPPHAAPAPAPPPHAVTPPRPASPPPSPPPAAGRAPARSESFQPAPRWESPPHSSPPPMPRAESHSFQAMRSRK